jgi:hypothetical protein
VVASTGVTIFRNVNKDDIVGAVPRDFGKARGRLRIGERICGDAVERPRIVAEFAAQAASEVARGLPPTPYMHGLHSARAQARLQAGFYGNNCICQDHCADEACYAGDVSALVSFGFEAVKLDNCGVQRDLDLWASIIASHMPRVRACSALGRFSVMRPTPDSIRQRTSGTSVTGGTSPG